jgi:catechol 2,3-dioxygenase-like lactoylglutathione lyase family enzyme
MKILKTLSRLYVNDLNMALEFYDELLGTPAAMRFEMPQIGVELAQVGDILLKAGSDEALKPFRSTQATFLVDSLDSLKLTLKKREQNLSGGQIMSRPGGT